jgi:hypothetical protein
MATPGPKAPWRRSSRRSCAFSDTYEIVAKEDRTWLNVTTGPLAEDELNALEDRADEAIREIKSLAEESAQIRGSRR